MINFCSGKSSRGRAKKKGKLPVSRRYDLLPLLPSGPDGVQRELAVRDLPLFGCPDVSGQKLVTI
jgi:hypothetical protein